MLYLHTFKFKDLPLFCVVDMYVCILYVAESPKNTKNYSKRKYVYIVIKIDVYMQVEFSGFSERETAT